MSSGSRFATSPARFSEIRNACAASRCSQTVRSRFVSTYWRFGRTMRLSRFMAATSAYRVSASSVDCGPCTRVASLTAVTCPRSLLAEAAISLVAYGNSSNPHLVQTIHQASSPRIIRGWSLRDHLHVWGTRRTQSQDWYFTLPLSFSLPQKSRPNGRPRQQRLPSDVEHVSTGEIKSSRCCRAIKDC